MSVDTVSQYVGKILYFRTSMVSRKGFSILGENTVFQDKYGKTIMRPNILGKYCTLGQVSGSTLLANNT